MTTRTSRAVAPGSGAIPFLKRFLRSPRSVASPFASSERMVRRLLAPLDWQCFRLIIEYGAGNGSFTRHALGRLPREARLIALDTDPAFTSALRDELPDPRLTVHTGSAEHVRDLLRPSDHGSVDCVISGIPFSSLDENIAAQILDDTRELLGPRGVFVAYQVRAALEPMLERRFSTIRTAYEWLNIPPCHLYWASGDRSIHPATE
jgi:phospholipid N-methyltransferase